MNSTRKYLQQAALLVSLLASIAHTDGARADVPAPPLSAPEKATVEKPVYPTLRLGDIAPMFALPDARGQLQTSTAALGAQSLLVVALPAADAAQSSAKVNQQSAEQLAAALQDGAARLAKVPVKIVVIAPKAWFEALRAALAGDAPGGVAALTGEAKINLLRDESGQWSRALGGEASSITLAAIDKAGFLRRLEAGRAEGHLAEQLVQMGDVTPVLEVGRAAPEWSVVDMNGRVRRLSDWRGQNVVLTFFPKCFTGGCANHLRSLNEVQKDFLANETQVIGVSFDSADGPRGQLAFAEQLQLGFPLVPDTGRNLALLYEAAYSPQQPLPSRMTVLIDRDGILRFIDRQVQTLTHGPDTLAKMRELKMIR